VSGEARGERVALVATLLLAIAPVATAWSGYQASRWGSEATKAIGRANADRFDATQKDDLANTQTSVDVAVFMQWANAYARGDRVLRDFYFKRFRAEFKPAAVAWIATRPLKNPNAPLTPFAMPQYRLAAREQATALNKAADEASTQARTNLQRSTNYVLGVVMFAASLFFAGMSTKLSSRRLGLALLAIGVVVFCCTLAWIATSPVSVSV